MSLAFFCGAKKLFNRVMWSLAAPTESIFFDHEGLPELQKRLFNQNKLSAEKV